MPAGKVVHDTPENTLGVVAVFAISIGSALFCFIVVAMCTFFSVARRKCGRTVTHPSVTCMVIVGICVGLPLGLSNSAPLRPLIPNMYAVVFTAFGVGIVVCMSYMFVQCWNAIPGLGAGGVLDFDEDTIDVSAYLGHITCAVLLCAVFTLAVGLPLGIGGKPLPVAKLPANGTSCTKADDPVCGLYQCQADQKTCFAWCASDDQCVYYAVCEGRRCVANGKDYTSPILPNYLTGFVALAVAVCLGAGVCGFSSTLRPDSTSPAIFSLICFVVSFLLVFAPMSLTLRRYNSMLPVVDIVFISLAAGLVAGVLSALTCACTQVDTRAIRTWWDVNVLAIAMCGVWGCVVIGLSIGLILGMGGKPDVPPVTAAGDSCTVEDSDTCKPFNCDTQSWHCFDYCSTNSNCNTDAQCVNGVCLLTDTVTTEQTDESRATLVLGITITAILWGLVICGVMGRVLLLRRRTEYYLSLAKA